MTTVPRAQHCSVAPKSTFGLSKSIRVPAFTHVNFCMLYCCSACVLSIVKCLGAALSGDHEAEHLGTEAEPVISVIVRLLGL